MGRLLAIREIKLALIQMQYNCQAAKVKHAKSNSWFACFATIQGRCLSRGKYNLPLLVADRITPADELGNALPDDQRHVAIAPEADPVTYRRDPRMQFQPPKQSVIADSN